MDELQGIGVTSAEFYVTVKALILILWFLHIMFAKLDYFFINYVWPALAA